MKVLDLGGGSGAHIAMVLPEHPNITVADPQQSELDKASQRGFKTVHLSGEGRLPFADGEFDVVFCSSVIEHVTGPKQQVFAETSWRAFEHNAWGHQQAFANEIRRISRGYFVQTPYKFFPIESHSWLPMPIIYLPRPLLERIFRGMHRFWPTRARLDWNLMTRSKMHALFPEAELVLEKSAGLTKSLIAIAGLRQAEGETELRTY